MFITGSLKCKVKLKNYLIKKTECRPKLTSSVGQIWPSVLDYF